MVNVFRSRRRAVLLFFLLLSLAGWALWTGRVQVPPAWNPWAPLDVAAPPTPVTGFKLARASADPGACRAALASAGFTLAPVPDRRTGPGCGFDNAFRIARTGVAVGGPFTLSCRAALALALWERHDLQPAARRYLGSDVQALEHLGSYACRNLYGQETGRRSRHATADALDIAGFVLDDGRRVRVLRDWPAGGSEEKDEARFLRAVRDGACRWFDAVLGPDYNPAHADHFHFDRGRARVCR